MQVKTFLHCGEHHWAAATPIQDSFFGCPRFVPAWKSYTSMDRIIESDLWPFLEQNSQGSLPGASAHLQSLGVKRRAGPARWHMALPRGLGSLFNPVLVACSPLPATLWKQIYSAFVQAYPSIISPPHFSRI